MDPAEGFESNGGNNAGLKLDESLFTDCSRLRSDGMLSKSRLGEVLSDMV